MLQPVFPSSNAFQSLVSQEYLQFNYTAKDAGKAHKDAEQSQIEGYRKIMRRVLSVHFYSGGHLHGLFSLDKMEERTSSCTSTMELFSSDLRPCTDGRVFTRGRWGYSK
ncbi:hypothetical protein KP509_07G071500 [Ceratopteris richardii]|uniref:Uncharacterized protein n=1 Tax=Ceratopteris richardii TaxID=49495 RepID=A0A8T2UG46_CERRI|nr:hypothetical protein KP509_07G071500 [Ceratopteris richardii]